MFSKKGFSFIEVLSPCPTLYQRRNKMGDGLDAMKSYKQLSKIKHGCPTSEVGLTKSGEIIVGKFVDRERPEFLDMMHEHLRNSLGEEYIETSPAEACGDGCCGCIDETEVPTCNL
jgi:2-oxoglutarate ferredoxin oxidoreductase subunit beta